MEAQELIERDDYIKIVNNYYRNNNIDAQFLFKYYVENEGMVTDISAFIQLLQQWSKGSLDSVVKFVFSFYNQKFKVIIITERDKFIKAI